jgi:hypothetical protein
MKGRHFGKASCTNNATATLLRVQLGPPPFKLLFLFSTGKLIYNERGQLISQFDLFALKKETHIFNNNFISNKVKNNSYLYKVVIHVAPH